MYHHLSEEYYLFNTLHLWPEEGFYQGGLAGLLLLCGRGSVQLQFPVGKVDMLHMDFNQTLNVLSSNTHYAHTFTVLS